MYSTLFEIKPKANQLDDYLDATIRGDDPAKTGYANYKSLQRPGVLLMTCDWNSQEAATEWREQERQDRLSDYRMRVGELLFDNHAPKGSKLNNIHFNEHIAPQGMMMTLIEAKRPGEYRETTNPTWCGQYLGLDIYSGDMLLEWDVFESIVRPGELALTLLWPDCKAVQYFEKGEAMLLDDTTHRTRHFRILNEHIKSDGKAALALRS